jgi:hypothetical protein
LFVTKMSVCALAAAGGGSQRSAGRRGDPGDGPLPLRQEAAAVIVGDDGVAQDSGG